MIFEVGRYYQHNGDRVIHVICPVTTFFYGDGLLVESDDGSLSTVAANDEAAAVNWKVVSGWHRSCYDSNGIPEPEARPVSLRTNGNEN